MRELKFRVWSKDYCDYYELEDFCGVDNRYFLEDTIVEQYTGLKDKNGKEIYEGDIVSYTTRYYGKEKKHTKVIKWAEWVSDDYGMPYNVGFFDVDSCMEVIGNIHENKELLNETNN